MAIDTKEELNFYKVDKKYVDFLRNAEGRVVYSDA